MEKIVFHPEIHTYHIDFAGHVSNIVYIKWMEIGRLKLLAAVGMAVVDIMARDIRPVLAKTEITYKRPLYLGDVVRVELWIGTLRQTSAEMVFRMYRNDNELVARASQHGLFVSARTLKPYRLSAGERELFAPFVQQGAD
jgi:acyl-CoA thioester hydrolase